MTSRSIWAWGLSVAVLALCSHDATAFGRRGSRCQPCYPVYCQPMPYYCQPMPYCCQPAYPSTPVTPPATSADEQEFGADLPKLEPLPKLPDLPSLESLRPKLD